LEASDRQYFRDGTGQLNYYILKWVSNRVEVTSDVIAFFLKSVQLSSTIADSTKQFRLTAVYLDICDAEKNGV
jgi:hypothetical protein